MELSPQTQQLSLEEMNSNSGRRPMNAFLLFCKRHRDAVKEKYPSLENRSITKILDKSAYTDLALEYKLHLSSQESEGGESLIAAPKPFKKRFLAAAQEEVENDDVACKALLQLAGVRRESPGPPERKSEPEEDEKEEEEGFRTLKKAVWGRVAKTLLKQEEERLTGGGEDNNGDSPINLSTQCTIRGQTIIEHIIENILDKSPHSVSANTQPPQQLHSTTIIITITVAAAGSASSEQIKEPPQTCPPSESPSQPPGQQKEPPQPAALPDSRPSRSCKGRRYQEFKEEAPLQTPFPPPAPPPPSSTSHKSPHCKPFNVSAKLNALPVLSLEDYQRKMSKVKHHHHHHHQRRKSGEDETSGSEPTVNNSPTQIPRRQSRSRNERETLIA
ncbi:Uncharacterized protein FKW44_000234 [Caligus rogercresseyi]|uniref:HMG box domain-containing protein n=1 Tax=Caligus rogercresseyi TaxID=217165 RepID=A0A7T8QUR2_CALRO|nr:Uncharacterized protein FKW44_000234 [Caligus rogercresseyi]